MSGWSGLDRVGVNRGGRLLLVIGAIDAVGTGLYLAGSAIFFTRYVGLSPAQVGIGLSAAGLLGMLAQTVLGWVADRIGPRTVLIGLNLWRAAGFAAYAFVHDMLGFVVVASLLGIAEQASPSVYQALVEQVVGTADRTTMSARLRVAYNVGFTAGALLCTVALAIGTVESFLAIILGDAATFVVAAALLPAVRANRRTSAVATGGLRLRALRDGRYVAVAGINAVLLLHMSLLSVAVPLWVTTRTTAPTPLVGILLVVNTVLAITFQVRAARSSGTAAGAAGAARRAGLVLAVCCVLFAVAPLTGMPVVIAVLVLGVVALTAGELWQSAGGWGLSYALAPETNRSEYLATFHLSTSAQYVLGPLLVTTGVLQSGGLGWLGLAVAFTAAALLMPRVVRRAELRPQLRIDSEVPVESTSDAER